MRIWKDGIIVKYLKGREIVGDGGKLALPNARIDSAVEHDRVKYALINGENLCIIEKTFQITWIIQ